ncbi:hypothetical protein M1271_00175 [Patescibacteria group bacterium]|nr:hypothetical protein [Patescibacteria group bacterium]
MRVGRKIKEKNNFFLGILTGALSVILITILIPSFIARTQIAGISIFPKPQPTPSPDPAKIQALVTKEVLPDKLDLGVSIGDTVIKMIKDGAIDKDKLLQVYSGQNNSLTTNEKQLLDNPDNGKLTVTPQNASFILNLLWPLGISNKTAVLAKGPMGTQYKNDVGNFASTGGWTLGKIPGEELFNKFNLIQLTPQQEQEITEISQNIYRPCCGNSTYFPDCNHGAAMLGFLELAVSQEMPKDEIYKKALVLNSYWFPQTYVENALYFKTQKGISWDKVDPKVVLGANYSSGTGFAQIDKELQSKEIVPKVNSGSSC